MDKINKFTKVTFQEVSDYFFKYNKMENSKNRFVLKLLLDANKQAKIWYKSKISPDIAFNIILPVHNHNNAYWLPKSLVSHFSGKMKFIPKKLRPFLYNRNNLAPLSGLTVKEVSEKIQKLEKREAEEHSKCLQQIKFFNGIKLDTVFLSQFPIDKLSFHKFLQKRTSSQLIALDGFHRLLSLLYPIPIDFDFIDC